MLDDLHRQVSNMSIEEEGEGVVLYFCNADSGECLCLGKLKTVQCKRKVDCRSFGAKIKGEITFVPRRLRNSGFALWEI